MCEGNAKRLRRVPGKSTPAANVDSGPRLGWVTEQELLQETCRSQGAAVEGAE